jgi:deoxyribonuclease IV
MLLGAHESVKGGLHNAFGFAREDACEGIQIFTKSSGQWKDPTHTAEQIAAFRDARAAARCGTSPVLAHGSYLPNLCSSDRALVERSRVSLVNEVLRCDAFGIEHIVFHPGAHMGVGTRAGVDRVVENLAWVLERTSGARASLTLENTAGQGTCLGASFTELGEIVRGLDQVMPSESHRVHVCIDTCHAYAAGYDLATEAGFDAAFLELDREIGVHRIRAFHLNDSLKPLGCRVDRHATPGRGEMGLYPFQRLVNDARLKDVVGVVELPPTEVRRGREVRVIKPLLKKLRALVITP